jgi:hypothetical protein
MASPDIKTIGGILGHVAVESGLNFNYLGTLLENPSSSGHIYKINAIFAANSSSSDKTFSITIDQGSGSEYLVWDLDLPYGATQIVSTKETYFYLEEGHKILGFASSGNSVDVTICYEVLSPTTNTLNLRDPVGIYGKTKVYNDVPNSGLTNILEQSNSSKVFKINSIFVANANVGSMRIDVQLDIRDADDTDLGTAYLAKNLLVSGKSTQIVSTKETYFYLTAGASASSYIKAKSTDSTGVNIIIGYEEIEGRT